MEKATTIVIIVLLVIIAISLIIIAYFLLSNKQPSIVGEVIKENNLEPIASYNPTEIAYDTPKCEQIKNDVDVQGLDIIETEYGYLMKLRVVNKEDKMLDLRIKGCVSLSGIKETDICQGGFGVLVKPQSFENLNISVTTNFKSKDVMYRGEIEGGDIYKTLCS